MNQKTALYRHYDEANKLLYVGVSISALTRYLSHKNGSDWSDEAVRMEVEWFNSREEALDAEIEAIKNELPIYNIQHKRKKQKTKRKKSDMDWNKIIIRIQRHGGLTEAEIAKKVKSTQQSISWLKRKATTDPKWTLGDKLIGLDKDIKGG